MAVQQKKSSAAPVLPKHIGLCGHMGVGKSTVADAISRYLEKSNWHITGFGYTVKRIVQAMSGCDPLDMFVDEAKKAVSPVTKVTFGKMMQDTAELYRAKYGPNIWTDMVFKDPFFEDKHLIIEDIRYPSDVTAMLSHGGIVIRVVRPSTMNVINDGRDKGHASETALDGYQSKYTIVNDDSLDALDQKVKSLLVSLHLLK